MGGGYTFCRYFAALLIIFYGFAKVNDAQFTVLQSVLDQPLGEVSGFWLTWYYFGYSEAYGTLIALVQIGGGLMLLFRKTALLGSCLLLPVIANIVLVNVFFGIDAGALVASLLIATCLLVVVRPHWNELVRVFWRPAPRSFSDLASAGGLVKWGVRAAVVLFPAVLTYWIANYNNRSLTPIDGAWAVADVRGAAATTDFPDRIYFERNRAYMSVFAYADSMETHHFEVDEDERVLAIWEEWLQKGERLFSGTYDLQRDRLQLRGVLQTAPDSAAVPDSVYVELVRRGDGP